MYMPASWPSLGNYYVLENTYMSAICASQTTSTKINCLTFLSFLQQEMLQSGDEGDQFSR